MATSTAAPRVTETARSGTAADSPGRLLTSTVLVVLASATAATLAATPELLVPAAERLEGPGLLTDIGAPMLRGLRLLCAVGTVGTIVVVQLLGRGPERDTARLRVVAGRWAAAWAAVTIASLTFDLSQGSGTPVAELVADGGSEALEVLARQVQALILSAWLAALVAFFVHRVASHLGTVIVSGVALAALIPPVLVGHSGSSVASPLATGSLVLHVVAITLWTGGLLALCAHVGTSPLRQRGEVVARFSTLALACYVAVAASGLANVAARVAPDELWENRDYLGLLTAKIALFAVLGGFGWMHRRRFVRRTDQDLSPSFWSLAGVEVLLMVAALGIAVVLSHTAPGMPGH